MKQVMALAVMLVLAASALAAAAQTAAHTGGSKKKPLARTAAIAVSQRLDTMQQAIDAPRWLSAAAISGHGAEPLLMEDRFPAEVRAGLAAMGHKVVPLGPYEDLMGHAQAIMLCEDGLLAGGADPRGDGIAAAW